MKVSHPEYLKKLNLGLVDGIGTTINISLGLKLLSVSKESWEKLEELIDSSLKITISKFLEEEEQ